jgi:hypothetical protein
MTGEGSPFKNRRRNAGVNVNTTDATAGATALCLLRIDEKTVWPPVKHIAKSTCILRLPYIVRRFISRSATKQMEALLAGDFDDDDDDDDDS